MSDLEPKDHGALAVAKLYYIPETSEFGLLVEPENDHPYFEHAFEKAEKYLPGALPFHGETITKIEAWQTNGIKPNDA